MTTIYWPNKKKKALESIKVGVQKPTYCRQLLMERRTRSHSTTQGIPLVGHACLIKIKITIKYKFLFRIPRIPFLFGLIIVLIQNTLWNTMVDNQELEETLVLARLSHFLYDLTVP